MTITPEGGRVLGCLVEKQLTTPQQYPLTLNGLSQACNQATNRVPVMTLDDDAIGLALSELKDLRLVRFVLPSHGKSVTRYRHVLDEAYGLDTGRVALVAVLMLRGPQTPGELRTRTGRMAAFDSLGALQGDLEVLAHHPEPLVHLLPRRPGQKEDRWQQLLAAEAAGVGPDGSSGATGDAASPPGVDVTGQGGPPGTAGNGDAHHEESRIDDLESEVALLRGEIGELRASLDALRQSLGG